MPVAVAEAAPADADPRAVRRAVPACSADRRLGPPRRRSRSAGSPTVTVVFRRGPRPGDPASTLKILTAAAVLTALGGGPPVPDHGGRRRLRRRRDRPGRWRRPVAVAGAGHRRGGSTPRGPTWRRWPGAPRGRCAAGAPRVRLRYDASLFSGPAVSPAWEPSYLPDNVVSPISAAVGGRGRDPDSPIRSDDPALEAAAEAFARALRTARYRGDRSVRRARSRPRGRQRAGRGRVRPARPDRASGSSTSATTRRPRCSPGTSRWRPAGDRVPSRTPSRGGRDARRARRGRRPATGSSTAPGSPGATGCAPETLLALLASRPGPTTPELRRC